MISATDLDYIQKVGSTLQRFKQKAPELWNFRCFACGDSKKNKFKARAFILCHKGNLFVKCHNCDYHATFAKFLDDVDPALGKSYRFERFKNKGKKSTYTERSDVYKAPPINFVFENCVRLSDVSKNHPAREFLEKRKIDDVGRFWYTNDFARLAQSIPSYKDRKFSGSEGRLIIPFYTKQGRLFAFQGRSLAQKSTLRYITIRIDQEYPLIYNLERIKLSEPVYVTEGPFDSLFLPNALAVAGSDFQKLNQPSLKARCTIVLDNEPRNEAIVSKYQKMLDLGFKVCIWPSTIIEKDINDMILAGKTSKQIVEVIDQNTYAGIKGNIKLNNWSKV